MQERISVLEQERISVLEQYLLAAGLDDYKLTTEDQETLNKKATFKPFSIGDLFVPLKGGYIGTGKKIGSATKARSEEYCIPLTCAKLGDNGIMYWGKKGDFRTYTNAISIIAVRFRPALFMLNRKRPEYTATPILLGWKMSRFPIGQIYILRVY